MVSSFVLSLPGQAAASQAAECASASKKFRCKRIKDNKVCVEKEVYARPRNVVRSEGSLQESIPLRLRRDDPNLRAKKPKHLPLPQRQMHPPLPQRQKSPMMSQRCVKTQAKSSSAKGERTIISRSVLGRKKEAYARRRDVVRSERELARKYPTAVTTRRPKRAWQRKQPRLLPRQRNQLLSQRMRLLRMHPLPVHPLPVHLQKSQRMRLLRMHLQKSQRMRLLLVHLQKSQRMRLLRMHQQSVTPTSAE